MNINENKANPVSSQCFHIYTHTHTHQHTNIKTLKLSRCEFRPASFFKIRGIPISHKYRCSLYKYRYRYTNTDTDVIQIQMQFGFNVSFISTETAGIMIESLIRVSMESRPTNLDLDAVRHRQTWRETDIDRDRHRHRQTHRHTHI